MNMVLQNFHFNGDFILENGQILPELHIAYHVAGKLNNDKSNVVWICHALTANSNVQEWWPGLYGEAKFLDPDKYFIVCANILASPYGSTSPLSIHPKGQKPYFLDFPEITIRDMVAAHILLRKHLGLESVFCLMGGSIGGFQAWEWAIMEPEVIKNLILIATGTEATPWQIALNESQRMAIEADASFFDNTENGGRNGLAAARSIALISYRNAQTYNKTQYEDNSTKLSDFKAASYQQYQGKKLVDRFNAYSYYYISKAFDSHHLARNRFSMEHALAQIKAKTLLLGISSDILFPACDMKRAASLIPHAAYHEIDSFFGHDGFLLEYEALTLILKRFFNY